MLWLIRFMLVIYVVAACRHFYEAVVAPTYWGCQLHWWLTVLLSYLAARTWPLCKRS